MRFLVLDTESGGPSSDFSLLTAYFSIYDNDTLIADLDLKLKPDDGKYILSVGGMNVNKINFIENDAVALKYKDAKPLLYKFISDNFNGTKLTVVGQSVKGDINIVSTYLISTGSWENFVSTSVIDTLVIAKFLQCNGLIPMDISLKLESLLKFFGVEYDSSKFHTAKYDTEMTWLLYKKMT